VAARSGFKRADYFAETTDMAVCQPPIPRSIASTLAVAFCVLVAHPAASEIYRWTDAQGNLHFTSDLTQIPERYRDQITAGEPNLSSISVLRGGAASYADERAKAVQERVDALRWQQRKAAAQRQPAQPTPKADPEPQKYEYNCKKRTKNGRCQRFRTAAWDKWNKRQ
jgi:hypothetical protein